MRTSLMTALTACLLLVLGIVPATAQDGPVRLAPCTQANAVGVDGDTRDVAAPTVLDGDVVVSYVLDLSGQEVDDDEDMVDRAKVDVAMTWLSPTDYDLDVNGSPSADLQPVAPSEERATASSVKHCGTVTITITNFAAPGLEAITLDSDVRV